MCALCVCIVCVCVCVYVTVCALGVRVDVGGRCVCDVWCAWMCELCLCKCVICVSGGTCVSEMCTCIGVCELGRVCVCACVCVCVCITYLFPVQLILTSVDGANDPIIGVMIGGGGIVEDTTLYTYSPTSEGSVSFC